MTEFDEQSESSGEALTLMFEKSLEYYRGEESFGVLMAYEQAALRKGVSLVATEAAMRQARDIVAKDR